jgi:hypothetical protein
MLRLLEIEDVCNFSSKSIPKFPFAYASAIYLRFRSFILSVSDREEASLACLHSPQPINQKKIVPGLSAQGRSGGNKGRAMARARRS